MKEKTVKVKVPNNSSIKVNKSGIEKPVNKTVKIKVPANNPINIKKTKSSPVNKIKKVEVPVNTTVNVIKEPLTKKLRFFNPIETLKRFFNVGIDTSKVGKPQIIPTETIKDELTDKMRTKRVVFKDRIKELYDYFLQANIDSSDSLRNRLQRYNDLSFMRYNSNVIWRAANMYAFEAIQSDSQNNVVNVIAKNKKVVEYIYNFFDRIGINKQTLTDVAYNLALYGDSFLINAINKNNITEVIPVSPYSIKERIEFDAVKVEEEIAMQHTQFINYIGNDRRLSALVDVISKKNNDYGKYFKQYLFGYKISDKVWLPPWGVTHFRLYSTESEFAPYGRSLFVGSLSAFRQLKSLETLQQMGRVFNFPTEIFDVTVDDSMTETEKWNKINEAREEFNNLNLINQGDKETESMGKQIWKATGVVEYRTESPNVNLGEITDIEMAMNKLVGSTDIPIAFLVPDSGNSFGTSGISLLQQYKPFARSVYAVQSAILEELSQMIRIQFQLSGDFPLNTEFELEMKYPVLEESSDRQRSKNDNIRLINDMISSLKDAIGIDREEKLPPQMVLDLFSKYSFIDQGDLIRWYGDLNKLSQNNDTTEKSPTNKLSEASIKKINNRLNEEIILETYFETSKQMGLKEGVRNQKHFISSASINKNNQHDLILDLLSKEYNVLKEETSIADIQDKISDLQDKISDLKAKRPSDDLDRKKIDLEIQLAQVEIDKLENKK